MKKYLTLLLVMLSVTLYGQNVTVQGVVTDAISGEPLLGVTVVVDGTLIGSATSYDGSYALSNIPANSVIQVSMIGYKTEKKELNNRSILDFKLSEDIAGLDEVVVIGYGTVKKSDLTSSISSVSGEDLQEMTNGNVMNSLQGKVAGVQVTSSGTPGESPRVIVRGVTTVNGSDPLYVVDGTPVGTSIDFLNQSDIESMEVLKDASATAIYGTRGSNGVILITTKKGTNAPVTFNVNASYGFQFLSNPYDMANAAEYKDVYYARYMNDGYTADQVSALFVEDEYSTDTDWWDVCVVNPAKTQSYDISFAGGSDKIVYSGSLGYYGQESNYSVGNWQRISARFNTEYKFSNIVQFGIGLMPTLKSSDVTTNVFTAIARMDPTTPVYIPSDEWGDNEYSIYERSYNNEVWNPAATLSRRDVQKNVYSVLMNPYININPMRGLTIRSQFGMNNSFVRNDSYSPEFYIDNLEMNETSDVYRSFYNYVDWSWTNTVNYQTTIKDKHNINAMIGYSMEEDGQYYLYGYGEGTPSNTESLRYVGAATSNFDANATDSFSTLISYLARFMYNYDSRYYLTASVRVDGSSKFSDSNRYGTFPSVSAAWRISSEEFMQNLEGISNFKLRLGWGQVGNQSIDSSAYLSLIDESNYVFGGDRTLGTSISTVGNTDLFWETVEDYNIGVDLGLVKNKLNITADYYVKTSRDMLLEQENANYLGYTTIWANIGSMQAKGFEVAVNYVDQFKDGGYSIGVNVGRVKSTVLELASDTPLSTGSWNSQYIIQNEVGGEISRFYGYVTDGLFQNEAEVEAHSSADGTALQPYAQAGDIRYVDLNEDGVIDENDKTYIGNAFPAFTVGINASVYYKNFDLSTQLYASIGNDIYNTTKVLYSGLSGQNVYAGTLASAWSGEGTSNTIPRLSYTDLNKNYTTPSDFFVEDGSYLRCKQLQLGYTLPKKDDRSFNLRLTLSAQNLFTITGYTGADPESASMGSVTESGIDSYEYPTPRTFLIGANFSF